MKIAVSGLGKMGMQIVQKLLADGHEVIGHDLNTASVDEAAKLGATAAYDQSAVITAFDGNPVVLWLMIPTEHMDSALGEWLALLPPGSILIDGGNSNYQATQKRAAEVQAKGSTLLDVGTSGGVWGYEKGFAFMVGGDAPAFAVIEPILTTLIKPGGGYHHFGPSGSGHYVKMVHNAIEYGMMESLAEGYNLLKAGPFEALDLAAASEVWQHNSVIDSWLNDLCALILKENPTLDGIEGYVAESGEARWALEAGATHKLPMPAIQAAMDVRLASQKGDVNYATQLLAAMRNAFGGHNLNKDA